MIASTLEAWHRWVDDDAPGGPEALLADDVVFHSPIVFTPQVGRALTAGYLAAAKAMFTAAGDFRYVSEVARGDRAVLEFEATVDGTWVNGVDLITCDGEGRISEFKVMIRPLRAVDAVHRRMRALLEEMGPPS